MLRTGLLQLRTEDAMPTQTAALSLTIRGATTEDTDAIESLILSNALPLDGVRAAPPGFLVATGEFKSACPASATVMCRPLLAT